MRVTENLTFLFEAAEPDLASECLCKVEYSQRLEAPYVEAVTLTNYEWDHNPERMKFKTR